MHFAMDSETFSGNRALGKPAILLWLSPRVKGSYLRFPFQYFHRHLWLFYLFLVVLQEGKKSNMARVFRVVLNLFAEFIAYLALFISLSMHQEAQMKSSNAFFNTSSHAIPSLSMHLQGAALPFYMICTSIERQHQEISAMPALKTRDKRFL